MKIVTAIAFATLIAASATALAHPGTPGVDRREARQAARIAEGVRSGALTPREARRLARQQAAIRAEERVFRRDGRVTARERAFLHHRLDAASRHIWREKHDAQVR